MGKVLTEPVTGLRRAAETVCEGVWYFGDDGSSNRLRAVSESMNGLTSRVQGLADYCLGLAEAEPGAEVCISGPGRVVLLAIRLERGWLTAVARPGTAQARLARDLLKFRGHCEVGSGLGDEQTVIASGRPHTIDRPGELDWDEVLDGLSAHFLELSGRFQMMVAKEWRSVSSGSIALRPEIGVGFSMPGHREVSDSAVARLRSDLKELDRRLAERVNRPVSDFWGRCGEVIR